MMFRCGVVNFDIKNVKFNKKIRRLKYANNTERFSHAFRVNSDVTLQNLILIIVKNSSFMKFGSTIDVFVV